MTEDRQTIGGLRERVLLQRRDVSSEAEGGSVVTFVPMMNLWARVTAVGARPGETADGRGVIISHTVVLRHRGGIGPGDRFLWRGRLLGVVSAEDISGRRKFLACRCTETRVTG